MVVEDVGILPTQIEMIMQRTLQHNGNDQNYTVPVVCCHWHL